MDIFSPQKRSEIMSRIRNKNTRPETIVFKFLRNEHIYFKKHYKSKHGIVIDIALPRKKIAVFIDGDFWHGRTLEAMKITRNEDDFWVNKIRQNVERDSRQRTHLSEKGWKLLSVWGSDLMRKSTRETELYKIKKFLTT